jgi:hypothetical protein
MIDLLSLATGLTNEGSCDHLCLGGLLLMQKALDQQILN